jgi:3-oxoacyl-[acyl-carrier protein] reductase
MSGKTETTETQVAIVTGASRGIGAAVARRLARDGFAVVVNYVGREDEAREVVQSITERGGRAVAVHADVSDPEAVRALFDETERSFARVDVLINNAGIMPPTLPTLAETDDATFDRLFAVNVKGTFNTLREAARRLRTGGRIVNFSTSVIGTALPGYAVYGATKAAVETFTNIMAKELRGRDITVNAIAPGPTATELFLNGKTPETVERLAKAPPLERLGTPDDIAAAVSFLVSADGAWVNGQTLRANGGLV